MKEEYIKNFDQTIIGILETDTNGDQRVRSWPGRQIIGYYYSSRNVTTDFFGRILSQGNTVTSLLYKNP